jgi:iron complex transport system substrate-binding protein
VVSLHDVTTEIVVALNATDLLVGVADPVEQPPSVANAVARIARAEDAESVVALAPTLLLGMAVVEQRSPDLVRTLRTRGTDVLLGEPQTLDDVFALVTNVAARLGRPDAGAALTRRLRDETAAAIPARTSAPVEVFVYDCCDPAFTAGRRSVLSDLIRRAGGRNVFADVDAAWTKVPWETVLARQPQLIVIDDYAMAGQDEIPGKRAQLKRLAALANVPTLVLPLGEALGGIRSVNGLDRLARAIAAVAPTPRAVTAAEEARP